MGNNRSYNVMLVQATLGMRLRLAVAGTFPIITAPVLRPH